MEAAAVMAIALANGGVSTELSHPVDMAEDRGVLETGFRGFDVCLHCFFFQNKPPDWQDFVGIITLLIINSTISFIEENNAGNAAAALMARLAPKAKVLTGSRLLCGCSAVLFACRVY